MVIDLFANTVSGNIIDTIDVCTLCQKADDNVKRIADDKNIPINIESDNII